VTDITEAYRQWFEYDLYANQKVLAVIENHIGHLPDDTMKLFSHIIASHHIWNTRITGADRMYTVWERIAASDMGKAIQKNLKDTLEIISTMNEAGEINYVNTAGDHYINNIPDILFHVLTHNHYHRGQIARNLRENNIEPPETNYIVYKR
jgi:uncharacterized damage-inducible protein DinB